MVYACDSVCVRAYPCANGQHVSTQAGGFLYISSWDIHSSRKGQDLTDELSAALHMLINVLLRDQWTIAACVQYLNFVSN